MQNIAPHLFQYLDTNKLDYHSYYCAESTSCRNGINLVYHMRCIIQKQAKNGRSRRYTQNTFKGSLDVLNSFTSLNEKQYANVKTR